VSNAELITVVVGLAVGYWIISRVIDARTHKATAAGTVDEPAGAGAHQKGERADGKAADALNPEWIRANWHEILGVSPHASIEVIKSAYRLRAHQYHPDKTERLGPELRALAERKMQELNMAYAWATRSRRRQ
jgi:DnaJ-domain-containing protein 1